jgi:hypothetical protein
MAVSRLFRHLFLDLGLFLLVGVFLAVNAGWTPSRIISQLSNICTDSDGFANIRVWGQARGESGTLDDYCKDSKTNMEAYCTISGPAYTQIPCPATCIRGVCNVSSFSSRSYSWSSSSYSFSSLPSSESSASSSSRSFSSLPPMTFCTDSDAGLNYNTVGNVTEEVGGMRYITWDTCRDAQTLAEAYCDSTGTAVEEHGCPQGCDAGKCRNTSSLNSIPVFSLASSSYSSIQYSSYAPLSSSSAAPSSASSRPISLCPTIPISPSSPCTDTDGGINYARRGKVIWQGGTQEDSCIDNMTIVERYCSETGPLAIIARCAEKCLNGMCYPSEGACGGCSASQLIAFVTCDSSITINSGAYSIDTLDCAAVKSDPSILQKYDTIAYLGPSGAPGPISLLEQRLNEGAKIIIFGHPQLASLLGGLSLHYHSQTTVKDSIVTVTESNGMSDAFDKNDVMDLNIAQMYASDSNWYGDLFFEIKQGASLQFNGHFHGYLLDTATRKGLLLFVGLTYYKTKTIDFNDPFLAAHLAQGWDQSEETSGSCGLPASKKVGMGYGKPVIYLYPEHEQEVAVQLDFDGDLVTTYPKYDEAIKGWDVIAHPDGTMINRADGREYSYIFWNGIGPNFNPDFSSGFVVKGEDTQKFLQDTLARQGLRPAEYNEMIAYWLPYMEHHSYNLIHFAKDEYTRIARMNITPTPDALLRIFMVFKELEGPVSVSPQILEPFDRHGFSAVEWGGSEIDGDWKVIH